MHRERWEDRIAWDAKQAAHKLRCVPACGLWVCIVVALMGTPLSCRAGCTAVQAADCPTSPHERGWYQTIHASTRPSTARIEGPIYDLNDPGQAFELTRPLAEAARHGAGAAAGRGAAPELAALVDRAAALILPPLALVSEAVGGHMIAGCACELYLAVYSAARLA